MIEGWSKPIHTADMINTSKDEFFPSIVNDGSIYFTSSYDYGKGREDIYYAKWKNGKYLKPVSLDSAINSKAFEFNAFVDPSEKFILFSSFGRQDGLGRGDLYISKKVKNGNWQQAVNLGNSINSTALDYCPFVSNDGRVFYFTSNKSDIVGLSKPVEYTALKSVLNGVFNGYDNIYYIDFEIIHSVAK